MTSKPKTLADALDELEEAVAELRREIVKTFFGRFLLRIFDRKAEASNPMTEAVRARERLACEIAKRTPYDVETVYRVLELAEEAGLRDPEEFLRRCYASALEPIAILGFALRTRTPGPFHRVYQEAVGTAAADLDERLRAAIREQFATLRGRKFEIRVAPSRRWLAVGILGSVLSGGIALGAVFGFLPPIGLVEAFFAICALAACAGIVIVEASRRP